MAIDAGIYQAITPRLKTVADFDREAMDMEAAQQQRQLGALRLQQTQGQLQDEAARRQRGGQLRDLLSQYGSRPTQERVTALRQAGFIDEARDEEKFGLDTQVKQLGLLRDSNKMVAERFRSLLANPQGSTPQQAIQAIAEMRRMGVFAPVAQMQGVSEDDIAASMVRDIPPEPGAFASWLRTNAMQAMDLDKTLPRYEETRAGDRIIRRLVNPLDGSVLNEEMIPLGASPDAVLRAETTKRGQDMRATRPTGRGAASPGTASSAAPGATDAPSAPTGEDFLNSLPASDASRVRAILEGRAELPPQNNREGQRIHSLVFQADPNFNAGKARRDAAPLAQSQLTLIREARDAARTLERLTGDWKPNFGSKGVLGVGAEAQLGASGVIGVDRDAVQWWKDYRLAQELIERHALFGAALTANEQASWQRATISPGQDPKVIENNLKVRAKLAEKFLEYVRQDLISAGASERRVNEIAGRNLNDKPDANAPPADRLKEGVVTTFSNGQAWTLRNGQPQRVR